MARQTLPWSPGHSCVEVGPPCCEEAQTRPRGKETWRSPESPSRGKAGQPATPAHVATRVTHDVLDSCPFLQACALAVLAAALSRLDLILIPPPPPLMPLSLQRLSTWAGNDDILPTAGINLPATCRYLASPFLLILLPVPPGSPFYNGRALILPSLQGQPQL